MPRRRFASWLVAAMTAASNPAPHATVNRSPGSSDEAGWSPVGTATAPVWTVTAPMSIVRGDSVASTAAARPRARGMPSAAASRFPVPAGTTPSGTSLPASTRAAPRTVPSPPTTTTRGAPASLAAATAAASVNASIASTTWGGRPVRAVTADVTSASSRARVAGSAIRDAAALTTMHAGTSVADRGITDP